MKNIKSAISPKNSNGKAAIRIVCTLVLGYLLYTLIKMGKILEFFMLPSNTASHLIAALIIGIFVFIYIRRTLRRRYAYSYIRNYFWELKENGFNTCPRCGSSVCEHTGTGHRRVHVADKITTTHYSDGSTDKKTEAVYEHKSYKYLYHKCSNPACNLSDDIDFSFGDMPYKLRELRVLILGERHPKVYNAAATIHVGGGFIKSILAVVMIVAVLAAGFIYKNNVNRIQGSFSGEGAENLVVTAPLGKEENALLAKIRTIVKDAKEYELRVTQPEPNLFVKDKIAVIRYFVDDKFGEGFTVNFKGLTSDSGLKGKYTLMKYDGEICVFCDDDETIYPPDSDFYKTHYEALAKWNGKAMITALVDKIQTGEVFEKYTDMFVLKSDKLSVYIAEDGSVRLLDESGEKSKFYTFTPVDTNKPENYADYKPMGYEDEETDELQKILNKADYDATVKWSVNDNVVGELRVIDNGDGSYTFENDNNPTDKIAPGKYILYPQEKRYDYYKYENLELFTLSKTAEKHTEKDSPDTYKLLCDFVPENYVKAHLNLDNAKKKSILGLETTYTEDFGNGKKAVLEVEITGKVIFEHHESEDNSVRIAW